MPVKPCHGYPSRRAFIFAKKLEGWPADRIAEDAGVSRNYVYATISRVNSLQESGYCLHPACLIDAASERGITSKELLNDILARLTPRTIDLLMGDRA